MHYRYEYAIKKNKNFTNIAFLEGEINRMAEDGWSLDKVYFDPGHDDILYIFKREITY